MRSAVASFEYRPRAPNAGAKRPAGRLIALCELHSNTDLAELERLYHATRSTLRDGRDPAEERRREHEERLRMEEQQRLDDARRRACRDLFEPFLDTMAKRPSPRGGSVSLAYVTEVGFHLNRILADLNAFDRVPGAITAKAVRAVFAGTAGSIFVHRLNALTLFLDFCVRQEMVEMNVARGLGQILIILVRSRML